MKLLSRHTICFAVILLCKFSFGQGRVVINEFMPWSGCNTTSEFIELMNFGPGPMNIGCYIVTNGTYSVTIPPNTILQRGQYFILSGQDILSSGCANADSAVHVDLNWTTCNCANTTIPTTGDGYMQNGGNANEKVVLLDPNMNVIDAVSRDVPVKPSVPITTASLSGACSSKIFDLDTMNISYEDINTSTGVNNSFSRKVDGDCGWVKTTAISAHAPNKTGSSSSATYDFTSVSTSQCGAIDGSISIQVNASNVNALFPMNYTLGFDADQNGLLDGNDQYTYGIDNAPPSIDINHLAYGRYRITVASSSSCNLKSFDFFVFNCYTIVLPVNLLYFNYDGEQNGDRLFKLKVDAAASVNNIVLEAKEGGEFKPVASLFGPFTKNEIIIKAGISSLNTYRLKLTNQAGVVSYSNEIKIAASGNSAISWPNPVKDNLFIKIKTADKGKLSCTVVNANGLVIIAANIEVGKGEQVLSLPATNLGKGIYYVRMNGQCLSQPVVFKFIK